MENWNAESPKENPPGHHQFLFRLQTGEQADISSFASKLREDAQLIGAVYADKLSPHNLRHIRIAECGEDWDMDREEIKHVSAHEQGQHEQVYKDRDVKKLLSVSCKREPERLPSSYNDKIFGTEVGKMPIGSFKAIHLPVGCYTKSEDTVGRGPVRELMPIEHVTKRSVEPLRTKFKQQADTLLQS